MMATERTPMEELRHWLHYHRNTANMNNARIRTQMIMAMIDGADKAEIEAMARAVGLHVKQDDATNE